MSKQDLLATLSRIDRKEFRAFDTHLDAMKAANDGVKVVQKDATECALRIFRRVPGKTVAEVEANAERAVELLNRADKPPAEDPRVVKFREFLASGKPGEVKTLLKDIEGMIPSQKAEIGARKVK